MNAKSKTVTLVLLVIFFTGLSVLLYPAFSQYWNSKVQSQVIVDYSRMTENADERDYSAIFSQAYDYNRRLAALEDPMRQSSELDNYGSVLNLNGYGMMGYITIDKIQVELPIYHTTSDSVLASACGHVEWSSLPVGGPGTHSVLSAHRGLPNAKLFTNLDKMQVGDTFTITILNQVLTYQVDQVLIVKPNDASDLVIEPGKDYCTLLTCTPYGINSHRLLVRGSRIETIAKKSYIITSEAYLIDRLIVTPLVALPILFVLIVYVILKPARRKPKDEDIGIKHEENA